MNLKLVAGGRAARDRGATVAGGHSFGGLADARPTDPYNREVVSPRLHGFMVLWCNNHPRRVAARFRRQWDREHNDPAVPVIVAPS